MIPPQPDRPNTPPLHLMPPDQPYARDLAASAYGVAAAVAGAVQSDGSSDEDTTHDIIVRQFGKSGVVTSTTTTDAVTSKAAATPKDEDGE